MYLPRTKTRTDQEEAHHRRRQAEAVSVRWTEAESICVLALTAIPVDWELSCLTAPDTSYISLQSPPPSMSPTPLDGSPHLLLSQSLSRSFEEMAK